MLFGRLDPDPGPGWKKSGSEINIPDHISELSNTFWVKNAETLCQFRVADPDPGCGAFLTWETSRIRNTSLNLPTGVGGGGVFYRGFLNIFFFIAGAVAISFSLQASSFCFLCSHFVLIACKNF